MRANATRGAGPLELENMLLDLLGIESILFGLYVGDV